MKKLLTGIMLLICGIGLAQQSDYTLEQLISLAQGNAMSQKEAVLTLREAALDYEAIKAALKPQLNLKAQLPNFYKSSSAVTQPDGSISFLPISQDDSDLQLQLSKQIGPTNTRLFTEVNLQRYENFTADAVLYNSVPFRVGIQQGINTFNRFKWDKSLNQIDYQIALKNSEVNMEKVALEVVSGFFNLLLAQVSHEIAETNRDSNEKIYNIAKERYSLGVLSKADLYQLELQLNKSEEQLISAKRQLLSSDSALRRAVNVFSDQDNLFKVLVPQQVNHFFIDPDKAVTLAWNNRPEQLENERALMEAEMVLEQERKTRGLQMQLYGSVGVIGSGMDISTAYQNSKADVLVQLGLEVPIFDGGQRRIAIEKRKTQLAFNQAENTFREQSFKQRVRQLVIQFNEIQEELEWSQKNLDLAQKRYEIANQRYVLNGISVTDLTLAFAERDTTWRNHIILLQSYWTLYYTIRELTLYNFETSNYLYQ
ncbi:Outer membrane protein TolC [Zhouia amylolytica]|uniref:Outer membrane protein TolC n=1 Tax=Zhouia amylolytica TaxID=376730 RepID=A0A1I6QSV4_9FLAO|nr:TolC family protein [Zhouia amylolytica]MCQ0112077.1 TolC family protein [Zhouia amylolytica]SFS55566.1 Outer membrane protein TolC [Zhouia amylolytica]